MRHDAFDNVACPFNYKAELQQARKRLDLKLGRYISEHPTTGYRELARMFGISLATLCAIAKKHTRKRKPGRRCGGTRITFDVRHTIAEREFTTKVSIIREETRQVGVDSIRSMLERYFKTTKVVRGGKLKADRHAEYTAQELHDLVYSASALKEKERLP